VVFDGALADLVSRYSDEKRIRLTFERPVEAADLAVYGTVEQADATHAVIRVPRAQSAKTAGRMLSDLPVADVTIDEIEADEVIRQMFSAPAASASPKFAAR
jgi:ABC-2 type transport system ATP-binding protein